MNPINLSIKTDDKEFFRELVNLSMITKHIKLKFPIQNRTLSPDDIMQFASGFLIAFTSAAALKLFEALLKKFSNKKTSQTTTIQNINIQNNYPQILVIIEKAVEDQQNHPKNESPDDK